MFPEHYVIYDSRVTYSLNWIILSQMAGRHYFPIPLGRNPKMCAFDIGVMIRQRHVNLYKIDRVKELDKGKFISNRDKKLFIPYKNAYHELNTLIIQVNNMLWDDDRRKYPYYTEMLLFAIADREIYQDITNRLSLSLQ